MYKMSLTIFFCLQQKNKVSKTYLLIRVLVKVKPLEPHLLFIRDFVLGCESENSAQQG